MANIVITSNGNYIKIDSAETIPKSYTSPIYANFLKTECNFSKDKNDNLIIYTPYVSYTFDTDDIAYPSGDINNIIDAISLYYGGNTDYNTEVALGNVSGAETWNKFGYNQDVDVGTEVVASFGAIFTPLTTETTLTIVSTSTDDDDGGTGTNSIVVYGIDANRDLAIEVVTMNGTTNVVTTSEWLGINRVAMFLCGTGKVNAGTINVTATTGGSQMAQMPVGDGVTQQCIFHVPRNYTFIAEWLSAHAIKPSAQDPIVTIKMWVYSAVSNGRQEVYRKSLDTSVETSVDENPNIPFPISESTVVWLEATTDKNDTIVEGRFSGNLIRI